MKFLLNLIPGIFSVVFFWVLIVNLRSGQLIWIRFWSSLIARIIRMIIHRNGAATLAGEQPSITFFSLSTWYIVCITLYCLLCVLHCIAHSALLIVYCSLCTAQSAISRQVDAHLMANKLSNKESLSDTLFAPLSTHLSDDDLQIVHNNNPATIQRP